MSLATAERLEPAPRYEALVIGAGFSGIGAAIELERAGIEPFAILEQDEAVGGVWHQNHYPGLAVDIASFTYSFAFEQNPDWSRVFAPRDELERYAEHCVSKYGLRPHLRLGVRVERIVFDEEESVWRIHTADGGEIVARYVLSATGPLSQPKMPDLPGLADFRGRLVHTARWDDGYDLRGKRVGVIGTGATSVQLVPRIAPLVSRLHVFQRTPIWVVPKPDREIRAWEKWAFRHVPFAQRAWRLQTSILTEIVMVWGIVYYRQFPWIVRWIERLCMRHLERQVPDSALRERLRPRYGFGCKRPTFSNEYFPTFLRENVELVTDGIERITERGIRTVDGRERELDLLVMATGYRVFEKGNLPAYEVHGRGGVELGAFWDEQGYQAYQGISVPRFPNYFVISFGPSSAGGSSWFSIIDAHSTHAVRCIREARRRGAPRVEIRREAHERYDARLRRGQKNMVMFHNNCAGANSYYFDRRGDSPFLRPASGIEMWWQARHFPLADYEFAE